MRYLFKIGFWKWDITFLEYNKGKERLSLFTFTIHEIEVEDI